MSKKTKITPATPADPNAPAVPGAPVQAGAGTAANGQPPAAPTVPREVAVKALIERGKKQGHVTYDEIATISAAYDEDDPEKGNELGEEIMGQGIEITEMPDLAAVEED